jgi:hypothetical protein
MKNSMGLLFFYATIFGKSVTSGKDNDIIVISK